MAGHRALAAVGRSLVELLRTRIDELLPPDPPRPSVVLVSSQDLDQVDTVDSAIRFPAISLYPYRVAVDRETRPGWSSVSASDGVARLPVRLHLLVFAWSKSIEFELEWLGAVARILEEQPVLSGPLLDPSGDWELGDAIQVIADDLSLDTMSEAFQALLTKYRLCLPYVVRVIRIGGPAATPAGRVGTVEAGLAPAHPAGPAGGSR